MRYVKMLILAACIMLPASWLAAQCVCGPDDIPQQGIWSTYGGTLLPGRASEGWCGDPVRPGVPGNTINSMSWNGAALGTQWRAWGMQIDDAGANEVARDLDANGTGWIDYVTNYDGGEFWLDRDHFGNGVQDLTGNIGYFNTSARVTFYLGNVVGVTSNITFNGVFNECPCCYLEFVISNALRVWDGVTGTPPPDYPSFLCGPTGELFDVCCIMASISCENSTEPSSWGAIKELYR